MELKAESRRDGMYDEVVVDVGPVFADIGSPEESRESLDPATAPALEPGQQETVIQMLGSTVYTEILANFTNA